MNGSNNNGIRNNESSRIMTASQSSGDFQINNYNQGVGVLRTENWLELFLTPPEKYAFSQWTEIIHNKSVVSATSNTFFELAAQKIPPQISPNLLTLTGLVMLVQAWYTVNTYGGTSSLLNNNEEQHDGYYSDNNYYALECTWLAVFNVLLFFVINGVTQFHADRIRQHTALSDLFKYACDSGSTVFLILLLSFCFNTDTETQWHAVQAGQLVLFLKHLSAFKRHAGLRYRSWGGPGEVLVGIMGVLSLRAVVGLETLQNFYSELGRNIAHNITVVTETVVTTTTGRSTHHRSHVVVDKLAHQLVQITDQLFLLEASEWIRILYYGLFVAAVVHSATLPNKPHGWTKFGLLVSLLMRLLPALLLRSTRFQHEVTVMDTICDGLFMAVLTSDLSLAKMANRELHQTVVLMSLAAVLSYSVILTLVAVYYIGVFSDLCFYLNLPILAVSRNVYCDGVYDLCHIGHKRAFQNALQLGNRLLVGVVGDEDASHYKRPPIMTHAERCAEVQACKAVTKVIRNAPCFGLTQDFLDEHQIHVVAFGEEYMERYPDPSDDPYYGYVRKLGIARPLPRTNTLSTTDLIERIQKSKRVLAKKSPT